MAEMDENPIIDSQNSGEQNSGSCLIAGITDVNVGRPNYWHCNKTESGDTFSIDMVRLKLTFGREGGEWLSAHAQTFDCDEVSAWTSKIRPGGWRELWSFALGESSVALGIGFFEPSCRLNMRKGFIEFNPNKVAKDARFWALLDKIAPEVAHASLKRFDLALDVRVPRNAVRMEKDKRMYKSVISNGITEYLGVKNTAGYVKVYDKAKEMGGEGDLTRIELTCDGEWTPAQVLAHWPRVHGWSEEVTEGEPTEKTRAWLRMVALALSAVQEAGQDTETLVQTLDWRTRDKVRKYLSQPCVELPESAAATAIEEAEGWCRKLGVA